MFDSRRRRTLTSLGQNAAEQESVEGVVQHLVANRLLATDRDLQSNEETVEIIHDVLLREWEQLKQWLEEDRRFLGWLVHFLEEDSCQARSRSLVGQRLRSVLMTRLMTLS